MCTNRVDEQFVAAAASILSQTFRNLELVIVCNGKAIATTESIPGLLGNDRRIVICRSEFSYLTNALNLGLALCRGTWVARMDADDVAHVRRIESQVAFMIEHPDVTVLGTAYQWIDKDGTATSTVRPPLGDSDIRRTLFFKAALCHPTVIMRRADILHFGGYMGSVLAEDYDLWIRMARMPNVVFANLAEPLLGYRGSPKSAGRRSAAAYSGASAAYWAAFVESLDVRWLMGSLITLAKRLLRSRG
jgi:glycosyltransferase involved in cell wall biosynthesis